MMPDLAVVILTKNEEHHIARCIGSIRSLAREIIVVDSFSTDKTVEIAKSLGAHVKEHAFKNYADQFSWALDHGGLTATWVMRMDADEAVDPELAQSIGQALTHAPDDVSGYEVPLLEHFFGRPILHGGRAGMPLLRIWRHGVGKIEQRWMDEHIVLSRGKTMQLKGYLLHRNDKPLTEWIAKHNSYSNREAVDVLNAKYNFFGGVEDSRRRKKTGLQRKLYYAVGGGVAPLLYFLYRYVVRGGFLDGQEGYFYHFFQGYWYRTLVAAKIAELERQLEGCVDNPARLATIRAHTGLQI